MKFWRVEEARERKPPVRVARLVAENVVPTASEPVKLAAEVIV